MAKQYTINGKTVNGEILIKEWVSNKINRDAVEFAERFGKDLAKMKDEKGHDQSLTTAQIRNVFGEVRRIQMNNKKTLCAPELFNDSRILLLRPKLAYAAKRAKSKGAIELADVLSEGLKTVAASSSREEIIQRFDNFVNFFEAVLAYHKAEGGKEN